MTQPATAREEQHILDIYTDALYRYVGGSCLTGLYPGIVFTKGGHARFASIVGWLAGMAAADGQTLQESMARPGMRDFAEKLAEKLHDQLTYLSQYGGREDHTPEGAGEATVSVERYKVALFDDGTFGGFAICWYRAVPAERITEKAKEIDLAAWSGEEADGTELNYEDSTRRWDEALREAEKHFRIVKKGQLGDGIDLEAWHGYYPDWDKKREYYKNYWVKYGFAFNGGLILHGMGHPTFTVSVSKEDGPYWGIHT